MSILLGIDTGGTYTDAVMFSRDHGVLATAKALTTKEDLVVGIGEAVDSVLAEAPGTVELVSLSTTLATNALVEGHGGSVCLILIGYREEALERSGLGAALGGDPVAFVAGGHGPLGEEKQPLDLERTEAAIRAHAPHVAAFAVAGYFGVRNPTHELAVRDQVRRLSDRPVTCAHELTSGLDAPLRAVTTLFNARLIPQLQRLIRAVRTLMRERGMAAPLMVVKGDGSLVSADFALTCPVQTILSGPAASTIGGRYLAGVEDAVIVDVGGTTTDIARIEAGRPRLAGSGATVGGWQTMVEAIDVRTSGLGGDSHVRLDDEGALRFGPRRVIPLSLLAVRAPAIVEALDALLSTAGNELDAGCFGVRLAASDTGRKLASLELGLWEALGAGPAPLSVLLRSPAKRRPFNRLLERGLVAMAGFTPSDAAHILGLQSDWRRPAALAGARILARRANEVAGWPELDERSLSERIFAAFVEASTRCVLEAVLHDGGEIAPRHVPEVSGSLITLSREPEAHGSLLRAQLAMAPRLVALGAPAETTYPAVARRLGARLTVPRHAAVANAVGAVVGSIVQRVEMLVSRPSDGVFRVHHGSGTRDMETLDAAVAWATEEVRREARERAVAAGAGDPQIMISHDRRAARLSGGEELVLEHRVLAEAVERPALPHPPTLLRQGSGG